MAIMGFNAGAEMSQLRTQRTLAMQAAAPTAAVAPRAARQDRRIVDPGQPQRLGLGFQVGPHRSVSCRHVGQADLHAQHGRVRLFRRLAPLDDLLSPEHAQVIVDGAGGEELALGEVPHVVVCLGALELFVGVDRFAAVVTMFVQRVFGPLGEGFQARVVGVVEAEVEGELSSDDGLFEEVVGVVAVDHRSQDFVDAEVAVVELC